MDSTTEAEIIIPTPEPKNIRFIRLNTGEDLVSEVKTDLDRVLVKDPMKVVYMVNPHDPSRLAVSLTQWIFNRIVSTQEFSLNARDILLMSEPNSNLIKYYTDSIAETKKPDTDSGTVAENLAAELSQDTEVEEDLTEDEQLDMEDGDYLEAMERYYNPPKPKPPTIH